LWRIFLSVIGGILKEVFQYLFLMLCMQLDQTILPTIWDARWLLMNSNNRKQDTQWGTSDKKRQSQSDTTIYNIDCLVFGCHACVCSCKRLSRFFYTFYFYFSIFSTLVRSVVLRHLYDGNKIELNWTLKRHNNK